MPLDAGVRPSAAATLAGLAGAPQRKAAIGRATMPSKQACSAAEPMQGGDDVRSLKYLMSSLPYQKGGGHSYLHSARVLYPWRRGGRKAPLPRAAGAILHPALTCPLPLPAAANAKNSRLFFILDSYRLTAYARHTAPRGGRRRAGAGAPAGTGEALSSPSLTEQAGYVTLSW